MAFSEKYPTHQNALDLLPGWTSSMPQGSGLSAGALDHFNDGRPVWAADIIGGFSGKSILEIGPFEAYNSYQFEKMGCSSVLSIEASEANFMRCLVVKNLFSLSSTFLLGDGISFMERGAPRFDVCWLSGVLYHMIEPMRLLKAAARVSDTLFVWTQYYLGEIIENDESQNSFFNPERNQQISIGGVSATLHYRSYNQGKGSTFSGGSEEYSYWMKKDDIFAALNTLGFARITMGVDNPRHPAGPACFFLAHRD